MWFELDTTTLITICAAISVVLFAEAVYLLGFSTASYRSRVNRRLKLSKNQPDREAILIQLRRERGLTDGGMLRFGVQWFNRLMLESGMTRGALTLALVGLVAGGAAFFGVMKVREEMMEAGAAGLVAGLLLPFFVLLFMRKRRHGKFAAQFPDAMDIIVRSLRAGHPVPVAVALVAQEMPDPIGTEFGIAADEITYGADVETAMRNLYFRVGQEDLPLFVTAVSIQGSTGGNLSEILENLSRVIRERFKMRRKIRALAAEGKFSALFLSGLPVAIFILLNVVAPDFYSIVWNQSLTKMGLALAATWMILGNMVMYKMCNFRI
ncbi:MAG: type II secretion system F family protein [Alphaproteobacteria bacterium]|nr:MAG: type II secretion system F family protein [Alphaproteobacteria bacterium]